MAVKKYVLKSLFRLETAVYIDGARVGISFSGGSKYQRENTRNGYFLTDNKEVQEALEKDNAFNSVWYLDTTNDKAETTVPDLPVIPQTPVILDVPATPDVPVNTAASVNTDGVTNYTEAKILITGLYPETTREQIISAVKLISYAKEKGITFPNWKI